jgi:hypothetical protein
MYFINYSYLLLCVEMCMLIVYRIRFNSAFVFICVRTQGCRPLLLSRWQRQPWQWDCRRLHQGRLQVGYILQWLIRVFYCFREACRGSALSTLLPLLVHYG